MSYEYKKELADFSMVMAEKLREKQYKEHWSYYSLEWLMSRLLEETAELLRAIKGIDPIDGKLTDSQNVQREAADIANFAMMIADNYAKSKGGES